MKDSNPYKNYDVFEWYKCPRCSKDAVAKGCYCPSCIRDNLIEFSREQDEDEEGE